jgi:hypothetical protein
MGPHLGGLLLIDRLLVARRFGASITEDRLLEPLEVEKHERKANDQDTGKRLYELDGRGDLQPDGGMRFEGVDDRRTLRRSEASRVESRIHVLRLVRGVLLNIKPLAILLLQRTLIRRRDGR